MTSMYQYLQGTPCAGCAHMGWSLLNDEPAGICTMKTRNRFGALKCASKKCEKLGFEYYEREDWKAEKAEAWAKKNGAATPDNAACSVKSTK